MTLSRCRQRSPGRGLQFEPLTFGIKQPGEGTLVGIESSVEDTDEVSASS